MGIQFTGLASGLDTQSIIADLMRVERMKVEEIEKDKITMEWKKDAWDDMNSKLYSFYKEELFDFKSSGTYNKKALTSSDESIVSLKDSSTATNGSHSITISQMAKGSNLPGAQLGSAITSSTTIADLVTANGGTLASTENIMINIKTGTGDTFGVDNEITINATDTIADIIVQIDELGLDLDVGFDSNFNTLFLSSTETGADVQLSMTTNGDADASAILDAFGYTVDGGGLVTATVGQDAMFNYNGADLTSSTNEIAVNGLNFDIRSNSGSVDIAVTTDTDAVYDTVKTFITKYNELMMDMNEKVDADSTREYKPLTADEKASMTDDEIELWEGKIKNSLLRRDDTLTSIKNEMRSVLTSSSGVITTGMDYNYFSDIGIVTGSYTEKGLLHIEGDEDDSLYSLKDNRLRDAIENNPDGIMEFLSSIGQKLYDTMYERMKSNTLSSSLTLYNDKFLDSQISDYEEEMFNLEDRLAAVEQRYYKQFTAMEQAIQQSNSTGDWLAQQLSGL